MLSGRDAWWRGGAIYQVYPRSFQDADGDGVGDLAGVRRRLPYLKWLGVDARLAVAVLRLADGRLRLRRLRPLRRRPAVRHAGRTSTRWPPRRTGSGCELILDYVPNHTSIEHPWFREHPEFYLWARRAQQLGQRRSAARRGSARGDRFYYHAYLPEQPDLDWRRDDVRAAMLDVLRFWCERGADGFRIDALRQTIKDAGWRDNPLNPDWDGGDDPYDSLLPEFTTDRPEVQDVDAPRSARRSARTGC